MADRSQDLPHPMPESRFEMMWRIVPWLLVFLVAGAEAFENWGAQQDVRVASLLSPAPALAAIRGSPRQVFVVSVGAVVVACLTPVLGVREGLFYQATVISAVLAVSFASLWASWTRERRLAQLTQVQRVAEAAQVALLPPIPRRAGGLRLAARYVAAESEARIGGDLYEAVVKSTGVRMIIGDVRGKGLPAVRTAAAVLGAFREAAHYESALSDVALRCSVAVGRLEDLSSDVYGENFNGDELFVTAAVLEVQEHRLRLVNLGHPPPLLVGGRGVRYVGSEETYPPLGIAHHLTCGFSVHEQEWQPGERLLLYTDGIDEARDSEGRFFPLLATAEALAGVPVDFLPDRLVQAVSQHTGRRLRDDAAVVVVEWRDASDRSGSAASTVR